MFDPSERAAIREATLADPNFVIDLLESALYDGSVDVTDLQEAHMLLHELLGLCARDMDPGLRARVLRAVTK